MGLWRSWERASMAWKRSSVRSRPGPPNPPPLRRVPFAHVPLKSELQDQQSSNSKRRAVSSRKLSKEPGSPGKSALMVVSLSERNMKLLLLFLLSIMHGVTFAQDYPIKPVHIIE